MSGNRDGIFGNFKTKTFTPKGKKKNRVKKGREEKDENISRERSNRLRLNLPSRPKQREGNSM